MFPKQPSREVVRQNDDSSGFVKAAWIAVLSVSLISCEMMGKTLDLFEIPFLICKMMGLASVGTALFSFKIM